MPIASPRLVKEPPEGIVSKRCQAAYIAGGRCGWLKVKTAEWREANRNRHKLFERARE